ELIGRPCQIKRLFKVGDQKYRQARQYLGATLGVGDCRNVANVTPGARLVRLAFACAFLMRIVSRLVTGRFRLGLDSGGLGFDRLPGYLLANLPGGSSLMFFLRLIGHSPSSSSTAGRV